MSPLFLDLSGASAGPVRSRVTVTFRCAEPSAPGAPGALGTPGVVTFADVRAAVAGPAGTGYLDRYFAGALPTLGARDARGDWTVRRPVRRLVRLLYPAFLDPDAVLAATSAALAAGGLSEPIRTVLRVEEAALRSVAAARSVPAKLKIVRKRSGNR